MGPAFMIDFIPTLKLKFILKTTSKLFSPGTINETFSFETRSADFIFTTIG
jgi:hypothetical protein